MRMGKQSVCFVLVLLYETYSPQERGLSSPARGRPEAFHPLLIYLALLRLSTSDHPRTITLFTALTAIVPHDCHGSEPHNVL